MLKGFSGTVQVPREATAEMGNADGQQYPRDRVGEERGHFQWCFSLVCGLGWAVKDTGVVGPRAGAVTVVLGT